MKAKQSGILEALELSAFIDEMRIERARGSHPRRSRKAAIRAVSLEDASRPMDGFGRVVAWRSPEE